MTEEEEEADEDKRRTRDLEILKSHASQLAEHFGSVQIFVTRHDESTGGTVKANWGAGDWFARYGTTKYWVEQQDEVAREETRKR